MSVNSEIPAPYFGLGVMILFSLFLLLGINWEWIIGKWDSDWHDI